MTPDELEQRIGILQRKLERELRARAEAEQLLESKARELQLANEGLASEVKRARMLSAAIDSATDGIALTDAGGDFSFMNQSHSRMFGYQEGELIGRPWSTLYGPEETSRISNSVMPVLFSKGSWRGEATGLAKDGTSILQEVVLTALPSGGLVCSTRDITERRKSLIRARELEMALQKAEKNAALYTLANAVAHDFNNLIAAISGYAALIQSDLLEGSVAHVRASRIEKAAAQASALVRSLEVEQMEEGGVFEAIDLVNLILTGVSIAEAIRPPDVTLEIDMPEAAEIFSTELILTRALFNIIKNAFEAMDGSGKLKIRLSRTKTDFGDKYGSRLTLGSPKLGYDWIVEISDTGRGIDQDQLHLIFDTFYSTKQKIKGSGLGLLSLVSMSDNNIASIDVLSEPGTGTVFIIYLNNKNTDDINIDTELSQNMGTTNSRNVIMIVEDDQMMADILMSALNGHGYETIWMEDPQIALASISDREFRLDVMITDVSMPKMLGTELAQKAKCLRPDLPIMLYSGQAGYITPDPAYFAILRKPISFAELHRMIEAAIMSGVGSERV